MATRVCLSHLMQISAFQIQTYLLINAYICILQLQISLIEMHISVIKR